MKTVFLPWRKLTCILVLSAMTSFAQSVTEKTLSDRLQVLEDTVVKLQKENDLLRKENQALRKALQKQNTGSGQTSSLESTKPPPKEQPVAPDNEFWLSSSGRRHNSRCRYFKTGEGKICTKDEGEPCKVCGG